MGGCLLRLFRFVFYVWLAVFVFDWIGRTGHVNPVVMLGALVLIMLFGQSAAKAR